VAEIGRYGGRCHFVSSAGQICAESRRLARKLGGHYMDQFTYAERATDWRGNNTIAAAIFQQLRHERHPVPAWAVVGAGTGGTSATIGRYVRYRRVPTKVCVVDPQGSVYAEYHRTRRPPCCGRGSLIEGIGRPQVEPSFLPDVIDRVMPVADAGSVAAMRVLARLLALPPGASTGTNFYGVLQTAAEMIAAGDRGSIVSLVCDPGDRYAKTCYCDGWLSEQNLSIDPYLEQIERFLGGGRWTRAGDAHEPGSAKPRARATRATSDKAGAPVAPPAQVTERAAATQARPSRSSSSRPPSSAHT
jgi:cysteine synthase A